MITDKDYFRITNCSTVMGFPLPSFNIEEVQTFLIKLGYEIIVHKGLAQVESVRMEWNEVIRTGEYQDAEREVILAIKPGGNLPERVDSPQAHDMNFLSVFRKEMTTKLLNI